MIAEQIYNLTSWVFLGQCVQLVATMILIKWVMNEH